MDHELNVLPWVRRNDHAVLYARYFPVRHLIFDQSRKYPDLIETSIDMSDVYIGPWHPSSPEDKLYSPFDENLTKVDATMTQYDHIPLGYSQPFFGIKRNYKYNPGHYKYVIVPLAQHGGMASSERLLWFLAHSGACIEGIPTYHITSRLQPWVHYVPIANTGADVAEKVQWLKDHEDMAKQIAINGRNF